LKTISDQLTAMDTQDAANAVGEAAQGSVAERRLAAQAPPAQIAYGWSGMPSSVASADTKSPPE
jgi:type VI secretion system protein ImpL